MISPSMMCCDFFSLGKQIGIFENGGVEYLHIDIMDGHFAPNIALGADFCKELKKHTRIPLDYHFMVEKPENILPAYDISEGDIVSVHAESTVHLQRVLTMISDRGGQPFVAINPATPISAIEEVTDYIDGVLVMSVNPGFAGQKLVASTLDKIKRTRAFLDGRGRENALIEVDGNVSFENAKIMSGNGANIFVAGTSGLFRGNIEENLATMRKAIAI